MALLDGLLEVTQADLPGQDVPDPRPSAAPSIPAATLRDDPLLDEAYLSKWRSAVNDEIRDRASKCLMDTFDRKNAVRGGKGTSPALLAARVAFEARIRDANQATLFEMLAWAEPQDKHFVFQGIEAVANQFMAASPSTKRQDTPRPRQ